MPRNGSAARTTEAAANAHSTLRETRSSASRLAAAQNTKMAWTRNRIIRRMSQAMFQPCSSVQAQYANRNAMDQSSAAGSRR